MHDNRMRDTLHREKQLLKAKKPFRDVDQFPEQVPRLPIREHFTPQQEVLTERAPR